MIDGEYCRAWLRGATSFFTVRLVEGLGNRLLVERIHVLRAASPRIRARHAFHMEAAVILRDN